MMRSLALMMLWATGRFVLAQPLPPIVFEGQPTLEEGISIEPYALFYEDPTGDTLQPLSFIAQQQFVPADQIPYVRHYTDRQMSQTSQVVWLQFQVANKHSTDTLCLWYAGDVHSVFSLYQKEKSSFQLLGSRGFFVPGNQLRYEYGAVPIEVPPHTTHYYFVRVFDYLLQLGNIAGQLHTQQSFQWALAWETMQVQWLYGAMAMMLGCLLLMSAYSLFQYFLNRDRAFLYYTFYTFMAACLVIAKSNARFSLGLAPAFLPRLGHPIGLSFSHMLGLLYALFLSNLLSIPRYQPRLWQVIKPWMVILALLQVMAIIQLFTGAWIRDNTLYFMIDTLPSLLMGILLIGATLRSHSKLKPFLLAGQISLYVVVISPFHGVFALQNLPPEINMILNYPPFYMALGLTIELFCFALALAYRNKLVEMEKNHLQLHYTNQLETELKARTLEVQAQSLQLEWQHIRQLKLDFEQQLAEVQMKALRAQMNPHFIFNCLNSIQLYTTSNEAAKATDYLNRFSQLIRLVLENSRSERVTLHNELQALELYLQMEAMRFKDKLRYRMEVAPALDAELIEIPPLLLQPYVENAIWHGLMHKQEGGCVQVKVAQSKADCLRVTITDDGIGRIRAAELKSKSATLHKSFGMKMTGERITLINQMYKAQTQVQIHDLIDAEGNPAGTEVVLDIPI